MQMKIVTRIAALVFAIRGSCCIRDINISPLEA
jgi:hypothetical protein